VDHASVNGGHAPQSTGGALRALATRTIKYTLGLSVPPRPRKPAPLRCGCAEDELGMNSSMSTRFAMLSRVNHRQDRSQSRVHILLPRIATGRLQISGHALVLSRPIVRISGPEKTNTHVPRSTAGALVRGFTRERHTLGLGMPYRLQCSHT
jgi:hypothetical protein